MFAWNQRTLPKSPDTLHCIYANFCLALDKRTISPPALTSFPPLSNDPNIFNLGKNESFPLNRNCDMQGFLKALVMFSSFLFLHMQASFYFVSRGSWAAPASKGPFRQETEWGPAHCSSLVYCCCRTWLCSPYGSWAGKRALALASQRSTTPKRSAPDSMMDASDIKKQCFVKGSAVRTSPIHPNNAWLLGHSHMQYQHKWQQDRQ